MGEPQLKTDEISETVHFEAANFKSDQADENEPEEDSAKAGKREEAIKKLEQEVAQCRKEYLEMEREKAEALSPIRKFFGITKDTEEDRDVATYRAYYDNKRLELEKLMMEDAKLRGVSNENLAVSHINLIEEERRLRSIEREKMKTGEQGGKADEFEAAIENSFEKQIVVSEPHDENSELHSGIEKSLCEYLFALGESNPETNLAGDAEHMAKVMLDDAVKKYVLDHREVSLEKAKEAVKKINPGTILKIEGEGKNLHLVIEKLEISAGNAGNNVIPIERAREKRKKAEIKRRKSKIPASVQKQETPKSSESGDIFELVGLLEGEDILL